MWYSIKFDKKKIVRTVPAAAFKHPNKAPNVFSSSLKYKYFSIQYDIAKNGEPFYDKATILAISDTKDGITKLKAKRVSKAPQYLMETETECDESNEKGRKLSEKQTCISTDSIKDLSNARRPIVEICTVPSKKMKLICEQADDYLKAVTCSVTVPSSVEKRISQKEELKDIVPSTSKCVKEVEPKRSKPLCAGKVQKKVIKKTSKSRYVKIAQRIVKKRREKLPASVERNVGKSPSTNQTREADADETPPVSDIAIVCQNMKPLQKIQG